MLLRRSFYLRLLVLLLIAASFGALGQSQKSMPQRQSDNLIGLMSSSDISGSFITDMRAMRGAKQHTGASAEVKGRLNLDLKTSPEMLKRGVIHGLDVTLVLFGVDYTKIAAKRRNGKDTGSIGFSAAKPDGPISFKIDRVSGKVSARIPGTVDNAVLSASPLKGQKDPRGINDDIEVPRQAAMLELEIDLNRPIAKKAGKRPSLIKGNVSYKLSVSPHKRPQIKGYTFVGSSMFELNQYHLFFFELARDLCVQPVRIYANDSDPNPTGAYLAVGMAGARTEWKKADVTFTVRPFKNVINSAWKVASYGERNAIRASVEDDDCIEIFFVENHDPVDLSGGGAAWGGGSASSQIVTSDGNNNGIDNTHLAHELGHVIVLKHPWYTGTGRPPGSTGTLMCGSGWMNDNPQVNSQENKENVSNPLFKYTLKRRSVGPDCTDDADCGPC